MTPMQQGSTEPPALPAAPAHRWYHKVSAVALSVLCLEVGLFLLLFPWTGYWDHNYFSGLLPAWSDYWDNGYTRAAVSVLGAVNLGIGLGEIFRLRRFSRRIEE
ncbi:MAG: hypothetical protein ABSH45_01250 [Bryobacteraceae bacterium]|jgi:hypothetical protein